MQSTKQQPEEGGGLVPFDDPARARQVFRQQSARRFQREMIAHHYNAHTLAKASGVTPGQVCRWLRGERLPSLPTLHKILLELPRADVRALLGLPAER